LEGVGVVLEGGVVGVVGGGWGGVEGHCLFGGVGEERGGGRAGKELGQGVPRLEGKLGPFGALESLGVDGNRLGVDGTDLGEGVEDAVGGTDVVSVEDEVGDAVLVDESGVVVEVIFRDAVDMEHVARAEEAGDEFHVPADSVEI